MALAVKWRLRSSSWQRLAVFWLLLAVSSTGAAWHHLQWRLFAEDELGFVATSDVQPSCIEAVALASPRVQPAPPEDPMRTMEAEERSVLRVSVTRVRNGVDWQTASGNVSVIVSGELRGISSGDRVRVVGSLSAPSRPLNPGEFDFATHQRRHRELCRINCDVPECVSVLEPGSGWSPLPAIHRLRDRGDALLWKHLRHERAGLAAAVLLGMREQVDAERMEHFMTTGTVHLLAISGLHVGILATGFWFVARFGWLSRKRTLWLAIALVLFYAMLTDARPPVVRAAILISVLCVARLLGRRAFDFNTLAFAALILLAIHPTNLFQTGTQLSFLAVATLACAQPLFLMFGQPEDPLQRLISQSRPWSARILWRCASFGGRLWLTSTVIWLIAMPLVMYRFHLFSPIAVLLNPILWLPMTLALFSGFGVLFFGWCILPLADVCGWFCDQNLFFIESCVDFTRELPGNHAWLPSPSAWWVFVFYGCLVVGLAVPRLRPPRTWAVACAAAWFAFCFAFTVGPVSRAGLHHTDELSATFVAVGHGTSVLVEFPDGKTLLYDSGRLGSSKSGVRPISSVLWSQGITHLDAVVISHADADHYNSLPGLLDRFSVGVVYVSPVMFRDDTPALDALREAIVERNVPLREIDWTDELDGGEVQIEILHPPERGVLGSDNANSFVLRLVYDGRSILLPGDLEPPGLEDVMAELPLDSDVVMAPHHGSIRSDPVGFSAWSTTEIVVISGGHERGLQAVWTAYASSGASVAYTEEDGAIRITLSPHGIHALRWGGVWQPIPIGRSRSLPTEGQAG